MIRVIFIFFLYFLTGAVTLDEVRQALQSYSYSVCYDVTAKPGTAGKGGAEDV